MIYSMIVLLAALVTASADLSSWASLDSLQVISGDVWRILTCHLTHLTWRHFAVDAPTFLVAYVAYGKKTNRISAGLLMLSAAVLVSCAVILMGIHEVYGGLSGLSCAAVSALGLKILLDNPNRIFPYLFMAGFVTYLLFLEGNIGDVNVAWEAHFAGTFSGLIFEAARRWLISTHLGISAREMKIY